MKRIGIYGGTYNPPHIGHLEAAKFAVDALELDRLLVIPDRIAPHKQLPEGSATPEQRLVMLQAALRNEERIMVSDMELRREGPSYSYITVAQLRQEYPDAQLFLLLGTDMFLSFHSWKNPDLILREVTLGVFYRGDPGEIQAIEERKAQMEQDGARVVLLKNPVVDISSTELRRMLLFRCAGPFLHPEVLTQIEAAGLYGTGKDYRGLSTEELERVVTGLLDPGRIPHVLGCRDTAVELAKRWGADVADAERAAMLHDVTKVLDGPLQWILCREYGIRAQEYQTENDKTVHALTGSLVAQRVFGEKDAVVSAIRYHTTGKADMSVLEKIIYVADYMEPNRDFPGVNKLRELAFSDLDGAVKLGLEMTLALLKKRGSDVSSASKEALDWLNSR